MLTHLLARMLPSGVLGGLVVHTATVHSAADQTTTSANHQLLLGVITTIGVLGAAAITGVTTLLISRSRGPQPVVSAQVHEAVADTAADANADLAQRLVLVNKELERSEAVIVRQAADVAEKDAIIVSLNQRIHELERPRRTRGA